MLPCDVGHLGSVSTYAPESLCNDELSRSISQNTTPSLRAPSLHLSAFINSACEWWPVPMVITVMPVYGRLSLRHRSPAFPGLLGRSSFFGIFLSGAQMGSVVTREG